MAKRSKPKENLKKSKTKKAITPAGEESRLINLAYNLAEQQLINGTASSQVITHFLKMGSDRESIERELLYLEGELKGAKKEVLEATARSEELFEEAIKAMRKYGGNNES